MTDVRNLSDTKLWDPTKPEDAEVVFGKGLKEIVVLLPKIILSFEGQTAMVFDLEKLDVKHSGYVSCSEVRSLVPRVLRMIGVPNPRPEKFWERFLVDGRVIYNADLSDLKGWDQRALNYWKRRYKIQ